MPNNVIPIARARALREADEPRSRYESLDPDDQRLVVRLADERESFTDLSRLEYKRLEDAGLIEVRRDTWDWTPVGAEVADLVRGMRGGVA